MTLLSFLSFSLNDPTRSSRRSATAHTISPSRTPNAGTTRWTPRIRTPPTCLLVYKPPPSPRIATWYRIRPLLGTTCPAPRPCFIFHAVFPRSAAPSGQHLGCALLGAQGPTTHFPAIIIWSCRHPVYPALRRASCPLLGPYCSWGHRHSGLCSRLLFLLFSPNFQFQSPRLAFQSKFHL